MTFEWSKYQLAIFDNIANGTSKTTFIEATAGSSKTTSLLEGLNYIPRGKKSLLVAFNKKIADELKKRAPKSFEGEISTLHSLGLKSLGKTFRTKVNPERSMDIIKKIIGEDREKSELRYCLSRAVSMAKNTLSLTEKEIDNIIDDYDLDYPNEIFRDIFIKLVIKVMEECKASPEEIDFDSMIYLPNVLNVKVPKYDYVFLDEYQDVNFAQLELLKQTRSDNTRMFLFGDQMQNIYSFRAADPRNIIQMKQELNAHSLPLSISYRCPIKVVKEAQKFVKEMEWAPNAPEGIVEKITLNEMKKRAQPGCFIISRVNAPLIGLALHFIGQGIPANIQGRDLATNLQNLIKKSRVKNIDKFLMWLDNWSKKEIDRIKEKEGNPEQIMDKVECLKVLAEGCKDTKDLIANIKKIFSDDLSAKVILLGSTHALKGAEADQVFVLDWTYKYFNQEEKNIRFVAITRAKKELYLVSK